MPSCRQRTRRASKALGERVQPAKREALSSAQLLRRRQRTAEDVDNLSGNLSSFLKKAMDIGQMSMRCSRGC